jgi:2,4-dienoyl-CoA reductase-like NADH-dependent reductase (Old Yellow Enzyme family)/thioredoxin reductase
MLENELSHLFQPIMIHTMEVRNRIVVPPMDTGYGSTDHEVTDQTVAYYRRRAEGGMGLIIVEYTSVDPRGRCTGTQLGIYDDSLVPGFQRLTEAVHAHGARVALQLHHGGLRARPEHSGGEVFAPSAIPEGVMPRELSIAQIEELVEAFGQAARRAQAANFDAVEIHGAHGYLINQFLSPWFNRRTDAYGGSFEKRLRFPLEVIRRVRELTGPDFVVGFRIIGEEMPLGQGLRLDDTVRFVARLAAAGIDFIHVSVGVIGPNLGMVIAPMSKDWGYNVYAAAAVKRAVDIPVITVGRITDVHVADRIVRDGHADLVAMGRASLADPDFPRKTLENRQAEIRKCFGCADACTRPYRHCNNNPELGREARWDMSPVANARTVWVVGGGVAGMEGAILAARRGHSVVLFERAPELGGEILSAAAPPHKGELLNAITNRLPLLEKYGVDVRLNTEVTRESVVAGRPDVIILATGARPSMPPIPGIDRPEVVMARDLLLRKAFVGPRVAVLGGGMVGAETAEYLADYHRDVTIIEMRSAIAADMPRVPRTYLLRRLEQLGVTFVTGATVDAITDHGVVVTRDGAQQLLDDFSSIVVALGSHPADELADALRGEVDELYVIGDAREVARIVDATGQAAEVVLAL